MSLADEMRTAADVLEAASGLYDAFDVKTYTWSATDLRREAEHVAKEGL